MGRDREREWGHNRRTEYRPSTEHTEFRLIPTEHAYQVKPPTDRETQMRRKIKSVLNKISPDSFLSLVDQLLQIELSGPKDLKIMCGLLFDVAVTEHHFCEMYADVCRMLASRCKEFPTADSKNGRLKTTFAHVLIDRCQEEFEGPQACLEATSDMSEDERATTMKARRRVLGNMKFIGQLYLRRVLTHKIPKKVIDRLIFETKHPEAHNVECVAMLLHNIGSTLESNDVSRQHLGEYMARMTELEKMEYPKRIKFLIQNLIDLQRNGWVEKDFIERVRTKDNVRRDALLEKRAVARGEDNPHARRRVAGERPRYILEQMEAEEEWRRQNARSTSSRTPTGKDDIKKSVRRIFDYYCESRSIELLDDDWRKLSPNRDREALAEVMELGLSDHQKAEPAASIVVALVRLGSVRWKEITNALSTHVKQLDDLRIDNPKADIFLQSIIAQLIVGSGHNNTSNVQSLLKALSRDGAASFELLCGTLKLTKCSWGIKTQRIVLQAMKQVLLELVDVRDQRALHDWLIANGVLTDPLQELMPKLKCLYEKGDYSVDSTETCLQHFFSSQQGAHGIPEVFAMQLLAELVMVLKKQPESWWEKIQQATSLIKRYCGSPLDGCQTVGAGRSCVGRCLSVDAFIHAGLSLADLDSEERREATRSLCRVLCITPSDLSQWCKDPMNLPDDAAEQRLFADEVLEDLLQLQSCGEVSSDESNRSL